MGWSKENQSGRSQRTSTRNDIGSRTCKYNGVGLHTRKYDDVGSCTYKYKNVGSCTYKYNDVGSCLSKYNDVECEHSVVTKHIWLTEIYTCYELTPSELNQSQLVNVVVLYILLCILVNCMFQIIFRSDVQDIELHHYIS